jgi:hypothetical protein
MSEAPIVGEPTPVDLPPGTVQIARTALLDVTPASTIGGEWRAVVEDETAVSVLFPCTMSGYPGWNWTVTLSVLGGDEPPSVLEVELLPGEGALLAPEWVPWSDRLAEYNTAQELAEEEAARAAAEGDESDDDETDDDEDDESLEETDLTDDLDDVLDGVEFEETDEDSEDSDDEDSDDEDSDDEDSDDDDDDSDDDDSDDDDSDEDDDYDAPRTDEDDEGNVY